MLTQLRNTQYLFIHELIKFKKSYVFPQFVDVQPTTCLVANMDLTPYTSSLDPTYIVTSTPLSISTSATAGTGASSSPVPSCPCEPPSWRRCSSTPLNMSASPVGVGLSRRNH